MKRKCFAWTVIWTICTLLVVSSKDSHHNNGSTPSIVISGVKHNQSDDSSSIKNSTVPTEIKKIKLIDGSLDSRDTGEPKQRNRRSEFFTTQSQLNSKTNDFSSQKKKSEVPLRAVFGLNDELVSRLFRSHPVTKIAPNFSRTSKILANNHLSLNRRHIRENSWNDHSVMHFGKRSDDSGPGHSVMHFGKRYEDSGPGHSVMHFGKRFEDSGPSHSVMHFGKRSEVPWNSHSVMHFGKRLEDPGPGHSVMHFGKRPEEPWKSHSVMHFGKRFEDSGPAHSVMHFGKRFEDSGPGHSVMHFGKRFEDSGPGHSVMHFGKRSEDPWQSHSVMHFGKKSEEIDQTNDESQDSEDNSITALNNFDKKISNLSEDQSPMSLKRGYEDSSSEQPITYFEKFNNDKISEDTKPSDRWSLNSETHFVKRSVDSWPAHSVMHFGKRDGNPWSDHSVMHFGKKSVKNATKSLLDYYILPMENKPEILKKIEKRESWSPHSVMHFGKRSEDLMTPYAIMLAKKNSMDSWPSHSVMHFGKRFEDSGPSHSVMHFGKRFEDSGPGHSVMHFGKRSEDPWQSHSVMHFGKRFEDSGPSHSVMHFGKRFEDSGPSHSVMHFGKRSEDPWQSHSVMHFGKRFKDSGPSHSVMHFGKRFEDSGPSHSVMHFGKRDGNPWTDHSVMHFGKRDGNPWTDHSVMHFGKRFEDPGHSVMHFGKRFDDSGPGHSVMHFGKRFDDDGPSHFVMHFGKRFDDSLLAVPGVHVVKRAVDDIENNEELEQNENVSFENDEKRSEDLWSANSIMHFGKRSKNSRTLPIFEVPYVIDAQISNNENPLFRSKIELHATPTEDKEVKRDDMWKNHSVMHFGKRSLKSTTEKQSDNRYSGNSILTGEKGAQNQNGIPYHAGSSNHKGTINDNVINARNTYSKSAPSKENKLVSGKNVLNSPTTNERLVKTKANTRMNTKLINKREAKDDWLQNAAIHFEKKFTNSLPVHPLLHLWENSEETKKNEPWSGHSVMHFGKRFGESWPAHSVMHFGKRSGNSQESLLESENELKSQAGWLPTDDLLDNQPSMYDYDESEQYDSTRDEMIDDEPNMLQTKKSYKTSDTFPSAIAEDISYPDDEITGTKNDIYINNDHSDQESNEVKGIYSKLNTNDPNPKSNSISSNTKFLVENNYGLGYSDDSDSSRKASVWPTENEDETLSRNLEIIPFEKATLDLDDSQINKGQKLNNIQWMKENNLVNNPLRLKRGLLVNPKYKRYWGVPFQGPKSMLYPHAWLAAQIRRSGMPIGLMQSHFPHLEARMAEKKEMPMNSIMHFG